MKFIVPVLLIASMAVLMLLTERRTSPVNDEPANIPSGYVFLTKGIYTADSTHPPLARYLLAVPFLFLAPDTHADHPGIETNWHTYGRDFIFKNRIPYKTIIFWPRLMNMILSLLLALIVFHWSKKLWGYWGGIVSLALFTFEPSVLGHGSLATLDMPIALFYFATFYAYFLYKAPLVSSPPRVEARGRLQRGSNDLDKLWIPASAGMTKQRKPTKKRFLIFALLLAATPLVKFSGLVAFPAVVVSWFLYRRHPIGNVGAALNPVEWRGCGRPPAPRSPTLHSFGDGALRRAGPNEAGTAPPFDGVQPRPYRKWKQLAIIAVFFAVLVSVLYQFEVSTIAKDKQIFANRESAAIQQYTEKLGGLINFPIPLYNFWKGVGSQVFHSLRQDFWESKDSYQYLLGRYSRTGWWYYFIVTFLLKTTMPMLVLMVLAVILSFTLPSPSPLSSGERGKGEEFIAFALAPAIVYFLFCLTTSINIGHRYLLPIYPFICLGFGYLTRKIPPSPHFLKGGLGGIITLLIFAHILTSLRSFPHYIGYFNQFAGGRENGWKKLADSNVDWGQDLYFLAEDIKQVVAAHKPPLPLMPASAVVAGGENINFYGDIFGTVKPSDLGINLNEIPIDGKFPQDGTHCILYISVNRYLLRSEKHPDGLYPWLYHVPPDRMLGTSILVWHWGQT